MFTGKALLLGRLYGPADLYFEGEPWSLIAAEQGMAGAHNPILSDLAFANLPWRAAVREAFVNGRFPLWNRFVLAGNPLLGSASAAILHPATWLGIFLPVALSWTFSCTFAIFLSLLAAFLFFRDFGCARVPASIGALAWGFSTYLLFWNGWSVGLSTASLPLLLLGLRRLADGRSGVGVCVAGFLLSFLGGHPESTLHCVAAGAVYFVWELADPARRGAGRRTRALGLAALAGGFALLLSGLQLFPLLEAIPSSSEYRARREALSSGRSVQSVPLPEATRRLLPDVLPFAHGIFGKSLVQMERADGSGMPLGYAGAVLFPLALLGLGARPAAGRGRAIFLGFLLAGLAYGVSLPGVLDLTARLPGFAYALNYRLVFLSALGIAGLAAFGAQRLAAQASWRPLLISTTLCAAAIFVMFVLARPVFRDRLLPAAFVRTALAFELVPLVLLAAACLARPARRHLAAAALVLLAAQRVLEMRETYPTLPASALAPALPTLAALPLGGEPDRVVAAGMILRPNGATLYGLEDVRGYEAIILDRFAQTYPLWSQAQPASFNRVASLERPFLAFLNVRYAIAAPGDPVPAGWREQARGPELAVFENPAALARAFVPRRLRRVADPTARIQEMAQAADFGQTVWLSAAGAPDEANGDAVLRLRTVGPDLVVDAEASGRTLVATS
ncbi:MAG: hypothetical protein ABI968_06615, partial [Acidobacteriota bacterium]